MRRFAAWLSVGIVAAAVVVVFLANAFPPPATEARLTAQQVPPIPDDPELVPAGQMPTYFNVFKVDKALTDRAYALWKRHCPGLTQALPYISRIRINDDAIVLNLEAQARGWPIAVTVDVTFFEDDFTTAWRRRNLLEAPIFLLGSGRKPGIIPIGDGDRFCLGKVTSFISVPELTFLKHWPSDNLP